MAESPSSANPADDERQLEEIAAELYAVRPDAFAAARDERVKQARAEGRPALARELAKLRRPTQSAWLINLLWRDQREVMEQLFELAAELSRAQAQASGSELRTLTAQRRQLETALIRRARELAEAGGVNVSDTMLREAQETLAAALAQPEVADEVRMGRLTKPAAYAGFGSVVSTVPSAGPPGIDRRTSERERAAAAQQPESKVLDLQAAKQARERREQAERRVQEARAAVEAAAGALAEAGRAAESASQHHAQLGTELEQLRRQLEQLQLQLRGQEAELSNAEQAAVRAAGQRDRAERTHTAALEALARAEQDLS
jgi:hypothetical protein